MKEGPSEFLISRLATSIVDESLPLKEVERELRGTVAHIAVRERGLKKRELASRCGVTEKSIENYLKETRVNPKSPDRELVRILQDQALTLEEAYEAVFPILNQERNFTLDDTKRTIAKLLRTGEVKECPGRQYRAAKRTIRCPASPEAYRGLVDQKARDLDYIILRQKQVEDHDLEPEKLKRFSRVVGDTNLIRIDFTVDIAEEDLADFYEKVTEQVAKVTMKYEKKKGRSRVRLLLGLRKVVLAFVLGLLTLLPSSGSWGVDSWELDNVAPEDPTRDVNESWELDWADGPKSVEGDDRFGGGRDRTPRDELPRVFVRGDVNSDVVIDIADSVVLLRHLFLADSIDCEDAADVDDSGSIELRDSVELLSYLFVSQASTVSTLGSGPVNDLTPDVLGCEVGMDLEEAADPAAAEAAPVVEVEQAAASGDDDDAEGAGA